MLPQNQGRAINLAVLLYAVKGLNLCFSRFRVRHGMTRFYPCLIFMAKMNSDMTSVSPFAMISDGLSSKMP